MSSVILFYSNQGCTFTLKNLEYDNLDKKLEKPEILNKIPLIFNSLKCSVVKF